MDNTPVIPKRILVVEDIQSLGLYMVQILTSRGYQVELAEDGEACLAKSRQWRPHLILLDVMMPKLHGVDVLKQLRASSETRPIGVIICTAKTFKSDLDQLRELGCFDIVRKPFQKEDLLRTVARFFDDGGGLDASQTASAGAVRAEKPYLPSIRSDLGFVRLWGTRGSIPVSAPQYVRHGGNTTCVVIGCGDEWVIIDAGSGIRDLGLELAKAKPRRIHLFITHTHWDHIQGFPFFTPAYLPGFELVIYGASTFGKDIKTLFRGQLDRDYFPVQFEDMRAQIEFRVLEKESLQIGGLNISWEYCHHPAATLGYKVEVGGRKLAFVSDNEFLEGCLGDPRAIAQNDPRLVQHQKLIDFLTGVDLLIHEAQYTNAEYQKKVGWGHSSLSNACLLARLTGVKRWIITHHDPMHDDLYLEEKLNVTKEILRHLDCPAEVTHAHDGMTEYF